MRKVLTLTATLLLAGSVALAQDQTPNNSQSSSQQSSSSSVSAPADATQNSGASITGCLNGRHFEFEVKRPVEL